MPSSARQGRQGTWWLWLLLGLPPLLMLASTLVAVVHHERSVANSEASSSLAARIAFLESRQHLLEAKISDFRRSASLDATATAVAAPNASAATDARATPPRGSLKQPWLSHAQPPRGQRTGARSPLPFSPV